MNIKVVVLVIFLNNFYDMFFKSNYKKSKNQLLEGNLKQINQNILSIEHEQNVTQDKRKTNALAIEHSQLTEMANILIEQYENQEVKNNDEEEEENKKIDEKNRQQIFEKKQKIQEQFI